MPTSRSSTSRHESVLAAGDLLYRHPHSAFVGSPLRGRVVQTLLRGQAVIRDGAVVPGSRHGRLVTARADNSRNRWWLHPASRHERIDRGGRDGVRRAIGLPPNEEEWYEEKDCRGSCRSGDAGIGRAGGRGNGIGGAQGAGRSDQGSLDLRRAAQRRRLVAGARCRPAVRAEAARLQGRHDLQGERAGGAAGRAGDRQPRP